MIADSIPLSSRTAGALFRKDIAAQSSQLSYDFRVGLAKRLALSLWLLAERNDPGVIVWQAK